MSAADMASAAEMAHGAQQRLARMLECMSKEQLNEFLLRLPDKDLCQHSTGATPAQPEEVGCMEVASCLVAQYGGQQAWDLALQTWEQMGLSELCAQARKEPAMKSGIKEKYQNQRRERSCLTQSWRNEYLHQKFTQLLLLHRSQPRGYDFRLRRRRNHEVADEQGHLMVIGDLFGQGLSTQKQPPTVVVHGVAGIGKSTLARQVRRAWEKGWLFKDRFKHVFYFNCRELARSETMSLDELITKDWATPNAPIGQILSQPEQLLFILDNLDELKWDLKEESSELCPHWSQQQQEHTLLGSLLKKTLLPTASLLITARITALQRLKTYLKHPRWVEVMGFSESARKEYFFQYFTDEIQASRAFTLVDSNPALLTMCLMPLVAWLVCTCLKQQMEQEQPLSLTSQTTTALCLHYFFHVLQAQSLGTKLKGFCSLAAEGICQGKTLFSPEDFRKYWLDGDNISTLLNMGVIQEHPTPRSYSFIHLCFQEFFAAMSYALCSTVLKSDRFNNIKFITNLTDVYDRHDLFVEPTTCFLFGLLSDQGMREMESIFKRSLSRKSHSYLLQLAKSEVLENHLSLHPYSWHLLHCFYEIQDKNFMKNIFTFNDMRICVQTEMELLLFTFFFTFCHDIKRLQLNASGRHREAEWTYSVFLYSWGPFTDSWWRMFFSLLKVPGRLQELDLSGNSLSCSAVHSLCVALKSPRCYLETLRLVSCGLTNDCCKDLASMLGTSPRLTELDLWQNDLGDLGVRLLCEGLRQPACQLRTLWARGLDERDNLCIMGLPSPEENSSDSRNEEGSLLASGREIPGPASVRLDRTQLSEEVTEMLRLLQQEKPQLGIISCGILTPPRNEEVAKMYDTLKHKKRQLINRNRKLKHSGAATIATALEGAYPTADTTHSQSQSQSPQEERGGGGDCQNYFSPHHSLITPPWDEEVAKIHDTLKHKKRQLINRNRKPSETVTKIVPGGGQTSDGTSPPQWQTSESEESSPQLLQKSYCLSSREPLGNQPVEPLRMDDDFWGPTGPVTTKMVVKYTSLYRVHFPVAGSYHCPNMGLYFVVRESVTIEFEFCAWDQFLDQIVPQHRWMVAGPLFDIKAKPGAVAAVYLPHFIALQGQHVDISWFQVAHIKEDGILMEKPDRVEPHYIVLKNPSFSPIGILLRKIHSFLSIPVIANVLLYYRLQSEEVNFHLYLIPSDCTIEKDINDEEKKFQFFRIRKPPPLTPLYMGSRYTVSGSDKLEIIPEELELCYRSPGKPQLFSEFYVGHLGSGIRLQIKSKDDETVVWEALVKSGDLRPTATLVSQALPDAPTLLHFVDQHREDLVTRVTWVDAVLDKLHGQVLSEEQYERVRAERTNPDKMRKLFSFSKSWGRACKDKLYRALKETHPHLIVELWEKCHSGGD